MDGAPGSLGWVEDRQRKTTGSGGYLPLGAGTMTALGSTLGMPKWPLRWMRSRGRSSHAIWITLMSRGERVRTVMPVMSGPAKWSQRSVTLERGWAVLAGVWLALTRCFQP